MRKSLLIWCFFAFALVACNAKETKLYENKLPNSIFSTVTATSSFAQSASPIQPTTSIAPEKAPQEESVKKINITIENKAFTATLAENAAAEAFVELLKKEPVVINMSDFSGFEKVGALGTSLPTDNSSINVDKGDIVIYNGNQIVLFYGAHSWSYTRLGKIDDLSGWEEALGNGDVTVTFSVE